MSTALPPSDGDRPAEGESEATPAAPKAARPASRAAGSRTPAPKTPAAKAPASKSLAAKSTAGKSPAAKSPAGTSPAAKPTTGEPTEAKSTAEPPAAPKSTAGRSAAAKATAATGAAKKPAAPRTRRTTAKAAPIAPEGEAPDIMDATLGARTPLAGSDAATGGAVAGDTSSSPAEPLAESDATTKRLLTAEELYASPASSSSPERGTSEAETGRPESVPTTPEAETVPLETTTATDAGQEPAASSAGSVPAASAVPASGPGTASASPATTGTAGADAVAASTAHPADAAAPSGPGTHPGDAPAPHQPASGRTVSDLADRLDDSRFFSSLFDFTFTNYVTRKLAGPVYVVGLVLIGLGIVVGFANALTSAVATHAPIGAFVFLFGVLITLVGAMLAILLLRVGIEVFCAIIEIAQNTRRRRPPGE